MALSQPKLNANGQQALDALLKKTAEERKNPAAFFGATNAKEEIYFGCGGEKVFGKPEEGMVNQDTTLLLFSMTKFITTIACMQAIDKGFFTLDDPTILEKHCPELVEQPILEGYTDEGKELTRKRTKPLTLRHLLTHTSGLAYNWNEPLIDRWRREHDVPVSFSKNPTISTYIQPLVFEPGTRHRYSIGIDWAGVLVSRVLDKTLEQVFQENIFSPCGVKSISFHPTESIKGRLMAMTERVPAHTGEIKLQQGNTMGRSMDSEDYGPIYSGGGGLFGTARDYLTILRHVLASSEPNINNTSPPLLSQKSFKALFEDCLDPAPEIRKDLAEMAKNQHVHDPAVLHEGTGQYIGHSPGLFLNMIDSKHGRKAMAGFWDGAAKTAMWLDPTTGLAAVCCTNLLSHNPDPWNGVFNAYERLLYDNLA